MERLTEKYRNHDGSGISRGSLIDRPGKGYPSSRALRIVTKLADYEDAEEQGLLIRLLRKVGDTAWYVDNDDDNYPIEIRITHIEIKENYIHYYAEEKEDCGTLEFDSDDFDKTIFFTREEAFSGLKEALSELNDTLRKQIGKLDELEEYNNAMDDYIDFINN